MKKIYMVFITLFLFLLVGCDKKTNETNWNRTNNYSIALESVNKTLAENENKSKGLVSNFSDYFVEIEDENSIKAARCFVYYLELLYKNEAFPITDSPVKFIGNYVDNGHTLQYNEMTMVSRINGNIINIDVLGISYYANDNTNDDEFYYNLVIDYDFDKNELKSFESNVCETDGKKNLTTIWFAEKYDGNNLYEFRGKGKDEQEFVSYLDTNYWTSFKKLLPNTIIVNTDFSAEYTKVTDDVFGKGYFEVN